MQLALHAQGWDHFERNIHAMNENIGMNQEDGQ